MEPASRALLLVVLVAACDRSQPDGSRGRWLVDPAAATGDTPVPWTAVSLGALEYGDSGGARVPYSVADYRLIDVGPAGSIALLDPEARRVDLIDTSGQRTRSLGRRGGGPGEMLFPTSVRFGPGSEVRVVDEGKSVVVRFDSAGRAMPERTFAGAGFPYGGLALVDGAVLIEDGTYSPAVGVERLLKLVGPAGTLTLATAHLASRGSARFDCGSRYVVLNGTPMYFAAGLAWTVQGRDIAVAHQDRYEIQWWVNGRVQQVSRRSMVGRKASPKDVGVLRPDGEVVGRNTCRVPPEVLADRLGVAPQLPVLRRLLFTPNGGLLAERYVLPNESDRVDYLAPTGAYVGTITGVGSPIGFFPAGGLVVLAADSVTGEYQIRRVRFRGAPW